MSDEYITRLIGSAPGDFVERPIFGPRSQMDDSISSVDRLQEAAERLRHDPILHREVRPAAPGRAYLLPDEARTVRALDLEISRLKTAHALKLRAKSVYVGSRFSSLATISSVLGEIHAIENEIERLEARRKIICG